MPLIILDRDGVINEDSDDYIRSLDEWHPIPGSINAIAELSMSGFDVVIATNQSGLSRGFFTLDTLEEIHAQLRLLTEQAGGTIAGIFYCPHLPTEGCRCRKPGIGLLQAIELELGVTVAGAVFIGDSLKDLQAAQAAQCHPILVQTGKGLQTQAALSTVSVDLKNPTQVPIYADLYAAAKAVLHR